MPYEDEIPKELKVNEVYSLKDIKYLLSFNDVVVLCEDTANLFSDSSVDRYRVDKKMSTFVHLHDKPDTYVMPNRKKIVYIISKEY